MWRGGHGQKGPGSMLNTGSPGEKAGVGKGIGLACLCSDHPYYSGCSIVYLPVEQLLEKYYRYGRNDSWHLNISSLLL